MYVVAVADSRHIRQAPPTPLITNLGRLVFAVQLETPFAVQADVCKFLLEIMLSLCAFVYDIDGDWRRCFRLPAPLQLQASWHLALPKLTVTGTSVGW
jgi:hypothetical protein